jgi:hypothetical protein
MKLPIVLQKKWAAGNALIIAVGLFMMTCIFLDSVEYPSTAKAGETVTFKLNVRVEPGENKENVRLVIGFLAPKSWKAAQNTTVTYTSNIDEGVQRMSLIPKGTIAKNGFGLEYPAAIRARHGIGDNVIDDLEWVAYWQDLSYTVANNEKLNGVVSIKTKVGPDNMRVKLGFFVNHSEDGVSDDDQHWELYFTDCFEVTDGIGGAPIDFCEMHLNAAAPSQATKDDILTFKYQGEVSPNALSDVDEIYLCAKAFTENGNVYEVCDHDTKTLMRKEGQFGKTYGISFWPADFFGIPEEEVISRIEYTFTNEDGTLEVMDEKDGNTMPFKYSFICQ